MDKKALLNRTLWILSLATLLIVCCYFYVDKQVAFWVADHHLRSYAIFKYLSKIPEPFLLLSLLIYIAAWLRYSLNRWNHLDQRLLMIANTIAITYFLKAFFKLVFGRTWPETWINNNPSLIRNDAYGFNIFRHSSEYGSFPSGHAAILFASMTILWLLYPRYRALYLLAIILGVIGIVCMNYHFVSDIIGGGVLGYLVALLTYHISMYRVKAKKI